MKKITSLCILALLFVAITIAVPNTLAYAEGEIIAKVDGNDISVDEFTEAVRYQRFQLIQDYQYTVKMYQMYGIPLDESFNSQYVSFLGEEGKSNLGKQVLDQLAYNFILEREAKKANITISDEEVTNKLKEIFGFAEQETSNEPSETALGAETSEVLGAEPEINKEIEFQNALDTYFKDVIGDAFSQDFFRKQIRYMLLETKVLEESVFKGHAFEEEMVKARHILVETEEIAKEVMEKIAAGEDWAKLAAEYSKDTGNKDNSGDLGWFPRGTMVLPFEEAAFTLAPDNISEPVKTDFGFHIIASDGKEIRPLEGEALNNAKYALFQAWYDQIQTETKVEPAENWDSFIPLEPAFVPIEVQPVPTESVGTEIINPDSATTDAPVEETAAP